METQEQETEIKIIITGRINRYVKKNKVIGFFKPSIKRDLEKWIFQNIKGWGYEIKEVKN